MTAIKMLRDGHRRIKHLFNDIENLDYLAQKSKSQQLERILVELTRHAELEEAQLLSSLRESSHAALEQTIERAIRVIQGDRFKIEGMFQDYTGLDALLVGSRAKLIEQLLFELALHTELEEDLFYPAVRPLVHDEAVILEALEEHHVADTIAEELAALDPADRRFVAKVKVLKEVLDLHIRMEERSMLKVAQQVMAPAQLEELSEQMVLVERALRQEQPVVTITMLEELARQAQQE